jgi:hypothetical protein
MRAAKVLITSPTYIRADHFMDSAAMKPLCSMRRTKDGSKIGIGSVCFA